ncbi:hypothetical protein PF007_g489 [Phytophthora fragariae]|uniref:SAM domain-containing protein n=2 Tax=Phytophthora fragariae TaxID=53985 RepID=A0A6A3TRT9_9STRA|nr:hypothetical protein PF007_g489 [Phytophthora fragariae]KAE9149985.1 hypothetical protein PF006_g5579 [Phytophthora fragariae]KAE9255549.1 hypothetical protein PF004_g509 [Phytophthora fragariae]
MNDRNMVTIERLDKLYFRRVSTCALLSCAPLVFPPCASFEKPYDLDIVKKIVEREGCLEALQQLLGAAKRPQQPRISGISKAPIVFQSIIDQLRSVSVQIVEDIDRWQQQQKAKAQATNFKWRGVNYLLKMTADLDFLASFRGVALLESLQVLRLTQNPFLSLMHLDHPALRDEDPEPVVQVFGNWVGDVSMRRVFPASRILLYEREADARRRQIRLKQASENVESVGDTNSSNESEGESVASVAPIERQQRQTSTTRLKPNQDGTRVSPTVSANPREAAMREDIVLCRELISQAEHELGAMRDELAALQARLEDTILPDKRRRLQIRIGSLVNDLKFRSGDVYQRKNELKRKEAIYRAAKDRRGSSGERRGLARAQPQLAVATKLMRHEHKEAVYSSLFESTLLEDEQTRNDLVLRVNASLSKARVDEHKRSMGLVTASRRVQKSPGELQNQQLELPGEGMEQWGVREVQNFLDSLGLDNGSYGANFRAQGIDGALLVQATDQDLEELGVTIRLHRVRILAECRMRQMTSTQS